MITRVLTVVLLLQLGLVAVLYWPTEDAVGPRSALVEGLDAQAISSLVIVDGDDQSVELRRTDDGWMLGEEDLPVDSGKVNTVIDALVASDPGFAIATSDGAATRFEVDEKTFERRITLRGEAGEQTVYLGSSPAFRKVHARLAGENDIFVLGLNSYDAPGSSDDWLDRSLLALRDLDSIAIGEHEFVLRDDSWVRLNAEPEQDAVDAADMETLLQALGGLRVTGVAKTNDEDLAGAEQALSIRAGRGDGERLLSVMYNSEAERYFLRSEDYAPMFTTSSYDAQRMLDAAGSLIDPAAEDEGAVPDTASEGEESTVSTEPAAASAGSES